MAIPPEPIAELLPLAVWVVEAEVSEVLSTGPAPPKKQAPPGHTSVGHLNASQVVRLKVTRVLRGPKQLTELVVEKPVAGYATRVGIKGAFLLDGAAQPVILGRYGPDTYSLAYVEKTLGS